MSERPPLIITTCSAGKRCRSTLTADALPRAEQAAVATAWVDRLRGENVLTPAHALYRGRAFATAHAAARQIGADFGVLSAGLGYVRGDTRIPSYDLTVRPGTPGSVTARVAGPFAPEAWWRSVQAGPFATDLAADLRGRDLVLVCLSRAYLAMVRSVLTAFERATPGALRLFGVSALPPHRAPHAALVPDELRAAVMPYDDRLERVGAAGTRVDFPQRALADFVAHVLPAATARDAQGAAVSRRLATAPAAEAPRPQRRVSDDVIRARLATLIPALGLGSSALLMHLRRVEQVSCEQRRFAALYRAVRSGAAT